MRARCETASRRTRARHFAALSATTYERLTAHLLHELRNAQNVQMGAFEMISSSERLPEDMRSFVAEAHAHARHASHLLCSMANLSPSVPVITSFELRGLAEEAFRLARHVARCVQPSARVRRCESTCRVLPSLSEPSVGTARHGSAASLCSSAFPSPKSPAKPCPSLAHSHRLRGCRDFQPECDLQMRVAGGLPTLIGPADSLRHVLHNLLVRAIKSSKRKQVRLTAAVHQAPSGLASGLPTGPHVAPSGLVPKLPPSSTQATRPMPAGPLTIPALADPLGFAGGAANKAMHDEIAIAFAISDAGAGVEEGRTRAVTRDLAPRADGSATGTSASLCAELLEQMGSRLTLTRCAHAYGSRILRSC